MFCVNCGKQIMDNAKFCAHCGAAQGGAPTPTAHPAQPTTQPQEPQYTSTPQQPSQSNAPQQFIQYSAPTPAAEPKKSGKGMKIGGIVMLVLGLLSIYGSFANGNYSAMSSYGMDMSDAVTIILQIGLVVGGLAMISKGYKR